MKFELEVGDVKDIVTRLKYAELYGGMRTASVINNTLEKLKETANANMVSRGVSAPRPTESIASGWRMKTVQPTVFASDMVGVLYNVSPHAGFVEVGTGPYAETNYFGQNYMSSKGTSGYFITPTHSRFLKFQYFGGVSPFKRQVKKSPDVQEKRGTGDFIFAKYVEGQEPKRYLGNAVLSLQPSIIQELRNQLSEAFSNLEKL